MGYPLRLAAVWLAASAFGGAQILAPIIAGRPQRAPTALAPVCMYQDNLSGPASGGEGGNGTYIDLFGLNFSGASVKINSTPVAQIIYNGADATGDRSQLGVQVAAGTTSGDIVVTTPGGSCTYAGGYTAASGNIYFIGPGTNNSSATGVSCATMKAANSYGSPWQVASNPTGTLNYDLQTALLAATPGTGYTTGTGLTIGSCSPSGGTGMVVNMQANSGGVGTFQAVTSVGTGYHIGAVCTVTQGGNTSGTATIWGYPIESYSSANFFTPRTYANCLSAGDTLVFLDGFKSLYGDGSNNKTALNIPASGSSGLPITYMARPGAQAILGAQDTVNYGIRNGSTSAYFNIYGLTTMGSQTSGEALNLNGPGTNDFVRVVNNRATCPDCYSSAAAISAGQNAGAEGATSVFVNVLGNNVTDASCEVPANVATPGSPAGVSNKQFHDFYMVGDDIEFGWNRVSSSCAFNGMQINFGADDNTVGYTNQSIHDNDFSEVNGACINLATVDPNRGYVNVYQQHASPLRDSGSHQTASVRRRITPASASRRQRDSRQALRRRRSTTIRCTTARASRTPSRPDRAASSSRARGSRIFSTTSINNICYQPTYTTLGKQYRLDIQRRSERPSPASITCSSMVAERQRMPIPAFPPSAHQAC